MKTIISSQSKSISSTIASIKTLAFTSWLALLVFATMHDMIIVTFLTSIGLGIISYFIFGKNRAEQIVSNNNEISNDSGQVPASHNYLSVFFHKSTKNDLVK